MSGLYSTKGWRTRRQGQLAREPVCRMCAEQGITTPATVADHIQPHRGDPVLFFREELQSLCKPCHDARKQSIEYHGYDKAIGKDGWPSDPLHPVNAKGRGCG